MKHVYLFVISLTASISLSGWAASSSPISQPHVSVSLVSEYDSLTPGQSMFVGLYLEPEKDWHVYWQNPGDSGLAPKLLWNQTQNVTMGQIQWPYPHKIPVEHLMNYGYDANVLLPVPISLSQDHKSETVTLQVDASWLVCKVACVPGKAQLSLTLPVKAGTQKIVSSHKPLFDTTLNNTPKTLELQGAPVQFSDQEVSFQLYAKTPLFKNVDSVEFFPITENLFEYAAPADITWKNNVLRVTQAKSLEFTQSPSTIEGIIVINQQQAWKFRISTKL